MFNHRTEAFATRTLNSDQLYGAMSGVLGLFDYPKASPLRGVTYLNDTVISRLNYIMQIRLISRI